MTEVLAALRLSLNPKSVVDLLLATPHLRLLLVLRGRLLVRVSLGLLLLVLLGAKVLADLRAKRRAKRGRNDGHVRGR